MTTNHRQPNPRQRSRRLLVTAGLASLFLLPAGLPGVVGHARPANASGEQYPNLETLPPRDLRFATAVIGGTNHRVLEFSNTVVNTGPGRLDVVGTIDPATLNGPAYQRVYDANGNYTQFGIGSFTWHAAHSHFHYDGWGRYELWTKTAYDKWVATNRSQGQANKVGTKTTSCIVDEEFVQELPGTTYPGVYHATGCDLAPDNTLHEGLTPGWGDTYPWYRAEQWIDLDQTPLADGAYVLRSVTDPNNQIYESASKSDAGRESAVANEGVTPFTVAGGLLVDSTAPSGSITVNHTAASTASTAVTVSAVGRDDVAGVDSFRLSSDGATWKTFAYTRNSSAPTDVAWDLGDPAYGGNSSTGVKTVLAQFHDASGKWGATTTDTIVLGSAPPPPPPPSTGYAGAVAGSSPVSYWRLGETSGGSAADAMGPNPGSYVGGVTLGQPSLVPTETDPSAAFGGAGSVQVPDAAALRFNGSHSLEAWIRPTSLPAPGSWASVVSKAGSYSLQFNGPQLEFTVFQNGTGRGVRAASGTIAVNTTYHVVGAYDGTTQRLFINGSQVASAPLTGAMSVPTNPLFVGSWDGRSEFFSGRLDDVAVYAKALSATQVAAHWNAGSGTPPPTTQTLTVTTAGSGTGSVTSSPTGISCPPTCSAAFPSGTSVTLTAASAAGSTFTGWTAGACSGTTPSCTFSMTASSSATASFAASTPPPSSGYATAVQSDLPLAYWRLGESTGTTATDSAGPHVGTYSGSPLLGQASLLPSDANTSVLFDGVNDHVRAANAADLQLGQTLTLEAWIRPTSLPAPGAWASVVSKAGAYSLQFNGPQLELTVFQNGWGRGARATSGSIVAGSTYHVVGTYDGTTMRLYVNGNQVASAALPGTASSTNNDVFVGAWDGASERFHGQIDEAAVYGVALSSARVLAHRQAGLG